jgi:hypothetical protein
MRLDLKKTALIIGFIALCAGIGFLIYKLFFAPPAALKTAGPGKTTGVGGNLPASETGGRTPAAEIEGEGLEPTHGRTPAEESEKAQEAAFVAEKVKELSAVTEKSISASSDGNGINYYDSKTGKFYKADENGSITELSGKVFHNVEKVTWSGQGDKAVLEYPDGSNITYDFTLEKQYSLPKHWKDFDFSPDGKAVASKSIGLDEGNRWLTSSAPDGSRARALIELGENEGSVITAWSPNSQYAAFYEEGKSFEQVKVFFIGFNKENFKALTVEGRGFEPLYNPSGKYVLYSAYSTATDLKPVLWSTRADGDEIGSERKALGIETWAHKCAFTGETDAICAVPESLEKGAGMMPELSATARDRIYRIDIKSGAKEEIPLPGSADYNVSSLVIGKGGRALFINDAKAGKLVRIEI